MSRLHLQPGESAIFGYGSLLWLPSLERTYGRPYTGPQHLACLAGWRRTWDVLCPNRTFFFITRAGDRCCPENILYLNIQPGNTLLNGMLYVMTDLDIAEFDRRENAYDRIDITAQLRGVEVRGGPAYVYVGKPESVLRKLRGPEHTAVRKTYIDIVENGLRDLGPEFRAAYEASTDPPPPPNIIKDLLEDSPNR
jgi:hypothetical protein